MFLILIFTMSIYFNNSFYCKLCIILLPIKNLNLNLNQEIKEIKKEASEDEKLERLRREMRKKNMIKT